MPKKPVNSNMVPLDGLGIIPERDAGKPPILDIRHLCVDFGGLRAVDDFTLLIGRTEIAGLIGPNGAGKTTVFNLLTNVYKPTQGRILLNGQDTRGKSMHELNRLGIARTFQNIRLFAGMTVEDNVKVGMSHGYTDGVFTDMFRLPGWWRTERKQHGGLARAVGPDEGHDLPLLHGKGYVLQGADIVVIDVQTGDFQHHFAASSPRYASMTTGFDWISLGVPLAMIFP